MVNHLKSQRASVLGDQEVGQVHKVCQRGVADEYPDEAGVLLDEGGHHGKRVSLHDQCGWNQQNDSHGSHVPKEIHGVHLLPAAREKTILARRPEALTEKDGADR
jgi:hypothetical protein